MAFHAVRSVLNLSASTWYVSIILYDHRLHNQCYFYFAPYAIGISLAQANTAGHTKKNVQFAILYIGYAVGNLIGPQTFRANQAPAYTGGVVAMLVCYCICIGLMSVYWFVCKLHNRNLPEHTMDLSSEDTAVDSFQDITDFKQVHFRYTT